MKFQILSHAGLRINSQNTELLCDPWLIGSCYWRSWWNYPPVSGELVSSLKPTAIYLTHIHWDHFQGPSIRLFDRSIKIIVPKGNYDRIKRDLISMGYKNVIELAHNESYEISKDFKITSYQFGPFLDSAAVIETDGQVLFNANDAKFMGQPLKQIKKKHPKIDFVFRSHSSANSRLCYEYTDGTETPVDDIEQYIENFADFCKASGAKYAIPFASNHCFLHKDVFGLNDTIQTPHMVADYWEKNKIQSPELRVMVSGDTWDSNSGFLIQPQDYFENRNAHLIDYQESMADKLEKTYTREAKTTINLEQVTRYFKKLWGATPWLAIKGLVGDTNFLYVLSSGESKYYFAVNLLEKKVWAADEKNERNFDVQIHTSTLIFKQCMMLNLFSHLSISKRVKYRVTRASKKKMNGLNLLFNCYEYEIFPLRKLFTARSITNWGKRWREVILYALLAKDFLLRRKINQKKYLQLS